MVDQVKITVKFLVCESLRLQDGARLTVILPLSRTSGVALILYVAWMVAGLLKRISSQGCRTPLGN